MTLKDILENCYCIDVSTLSFSLRKDMELDNLSVDEVKEHLFKDELQVSGSPVSDFDAYWIPYGDERTGVLQLYTEINEQPW